MVNAAAVTLSRHLREHDLGVYVGEIDGERLFADIRDCMSVVGPTSSGKSTRLFVQSVAAFPGPVVVTTTRDVYSRWPDVAELTSSSRQAIAESGGGFVCNFRVDDGLKPAGDARTWSPLSGCADWNIAQDRAKTIAFAAITPDTKDIENAGFFRAQVQSLLAAMLFVAARAGRTHSEFFELMRSTPLRNAGSGPPSFRQIGDNIARIVGQNHDAARALLNFGSGDRLDEKTQRNVLSVVDALILPGWLRLSASFPEIDVDGFLSTPSTIYIQSRAEYGPIIAPVVSAFIEHLTARWKQFGRMRGQGGLLLALDEVANMARLPTLPMLMSSGGGDRIQVMLGIQDVQRLEGIWGAEGKSIVRNGIEIMLPGLRDVDHLAEVSLLLPHELRRELEVRVTSDPGGGARSPSRTRLRRERAQLESIDGEGYSSEVTRRMEALRMRADRLRAGLRSQTVGGGEQGFLRDLDRQTEVSDSFTLRSELEVHELFGLAEGKALVLERAQAGLLDVPGWWESTFWKEVLQRP